MGFGGLGALSASCLLRDEENARGLTVALVAATRRARAVLARIADMVNDEREEVVVVVGEKAPTPHFHEQLELYSRVTATRRT